MEKKYNLRLYISYNFPCPIIYNALLVCYKPKVDISLLRESCFPSIFEIQFKTDSYRLPLVEKFIGI